MINWAGKRILVTGGAGFVGSHLARKLADLGANVTVADNLSTGRKDRVPPSAEFYKVDLRERQACMVLCQNKDYVFHLTANMGGIGYITFVKADIMSDNLRMNINMLEAAVKAKVKRFLFSSSACVYPVELQSDANVKPLKEDDAYPSHPDSTYGWEKLATEELCKGFRDNYRLDVRVVRFHNVYGPGADYDSTREKAVGSLIRKALRYPQEPFVIWGDGLQTRSFLYIDDAVEGTLRLMESEHDEPVNIGSDRLVTINELAEIILRAAGKGGIHMAYDYTMPQGVRGRNADLTLARRVLSWEPKVSLEEGVRRTVEWVKAQEDGR